MTNKDDEMEMLRKKAIEENRQIQQQEKEQRIEAEKRIVLARAMAQMDLPFWQKAIVFAMTIPGGEIEVDTNLSHPSLRCKISAFGMGWVGARHRFWNAPGFLHLSQKTPQSETGPYAEYAAELGRLLGFPFRASHSHISYEEREETYSAEYFSPFDTIRVRW